VREDTHPHLALTLQSAGDGDTSSLNLVSGDTGTVQGLDAKIAESEGVAGRGITADLAFAVFALQVLLKWLA
jgi:hypothetical protein